MKTITIGRSPQNDIAINEATVSTKHAAISILNSREITIKDLNSTNGTFVNGKRITTETAITTNDEVKVGGALVSWTKFLNAAPKPQHSVSSNAVKRVKTIGRSSVNDIVFSHSDVSGTHAQLIEKTNGEIEIVDTGSTNGTFVNGNKVNSQTLRAGDRVEISNKYPLNWESIFGKSSGPVPGSTTISGGKTNNTKTIFMVAAAAVAILVACFFIFKPEKDKSWSAEKIYATYEKSIVMIYHQYNYRISIDGRVVDRGSNGTSGTGFFISKDGKIMTNNHVAQPWLYLKADVAQIYNVSENRVNVTGETTYLGVVVNNTHVRDLQELYPCSFLKANNNLEIDVAIIQVNTKTLPVGVQTLVDLNKAVVSDDDIVLGESIYTIGFPQGFDFALTSQGIQATNQKGTVNQNRGDIEFGHDMPIVGGASGSPVFNRYGNLIGVVHRGRGHAVHGFNMAVKARHAVELAK
jgi:pSer/pThr/pTyr-binding forkhead associated (FHA) protein